MNDPGFTPTQLAARAAYLLRGNDLGTMTSAAPRLYPHMWSWDAAFVAVGLAPLSVERAVVELDTLLSAQWRNGMIPHIVFANGVDGYFPGPARWECRELALHAPPAPRHLRDHPAARARDRPAAHPRPFAAARPHHPRGRRRVPRPPLAGPGPLAPLAGARTRPRTGRPDHPVPRLGVRDGQLAAVGPRPTPTSSRGTTCRRICARTCTSSPTPPSGHRPRVRPLPVAGRADAPRALRRRRTRRNDEFRGRGRVRQRHLRAGLRGAGDYRRGLSQPNADVRDLHSWAERFRKGVVATTDARTGAARDFDVRTGRWIRPRHWRCSPRCCPVACRRDAERALLRIFEGPRFCGHPGPEIRSAAVHFAGVRGLPLRGSTGVDRSGR